MDGQRRGARAPTCALGCPLRGPALRRLRAGGASLTARGIDRIIRVAWTLADLHERPAPDEDDVRDRPRVSARPAAGRRVTVAWSEERIARQALLHAGDPGDRLLAAWVDAYGPTETVARLRCGSRSGAGRHAGCARLRAAPLAAERAAAAQLGARLVGPGDQEWPDDLLARPCAIGRTACVPHALWVRGPSGARPDGRSMRRGRGRPRLDGLRRARDHRARLGARRCGLDGRVGSGVRHRRGRPSSLPGRRGRHGGRARRRGGRRLPARVTRSLLARIADEGLVVSELPLGSAPHPVPLPGAQPTDRRARPGARSRSRWRVRSGAAQHPGARREAAPSGHGRARAR